MIRSLLAVTCVLTMLITSTAYAYKKDTYKSSNSSDILDIMEEQPEAPEDTPGEKEGESDEEDYPNGGPSGMMIGGYVLIALGGMAAIAGSTILMTTDKNLLGASISAGGAAVGLAGSMMLIFGSRSVAVGPTIDPKTGTYGVMVAKRF